MSSRLLLQGYQFTVLHHEGVARVTVSHDGTVLLDAQVPSVSGWVPLRFAGAEGELLALISISGRQGALGQPGRLLATKGRSPDFWKIATRVFVPGRHLIWDVYAFFKNLLIGVLIGFAVVWGVFSSLNSTWVLAVGALAFGGSYAIDLSSDHRTLEGIRLVLS